MSKSIFLLGFETVLSHPNGKKFLRFFTVDKSIERKRPGCTRREEKNWIKTFVCAIFEEEK